MEHPSQDFNEVLAEQLRRAPYLIASMVLHAGIALIITGIMLFQSEEETAPVLTMLPAPPPPEVVDPPDPPKPPEPIKPNEVEPMLNPSEVPDDNLPVELPSDDSFSPDNSPFDSFTSGQNTLGIGGPPGGPGGRSGGGSGGGGSKTEAAVQAGLAWLRDHQSPDGYWDADEFMQNDRYPEHAASTGAGFTEQ